MIFKEKMNVVLIDFLTDLIDCLINCLINCLTDCLIDCLTDCLIDFLIDFLIHFLTDFWDEFWDKEEIAKINDDEMFSKNLTMSLILVLRDFFAITNESILLRKNKSFILKWIEIENCKNEHCQRFVKRNYTYMQ